VLRILFFGVDPSITLCLKASSGYWNVERSITRRILIESLVDWSDLEKGKSEFLCADRYTRLNVRHLGGGLLGITTTQILLKPRATFNAACNRISAEKFYSPLPRSLHNRPGLHEKCGAYN